MSWVDAVLPVAAFVAGTLTRFIPYKFRTKAEQDAFSAPERERQRQVIEGYVEVAKSISDHLDPAEDYLLAGQESWRNEFTERYDELYRVSENLVFAVPDQNLATFAFKFNLAVTRFHDEILEQALEKRQLQIAVNDAGLTQRGDFRDAYFDMLTEMNKKLREL